MPAYLHESFGTFVALDPDAVVGRLQNAYASDGFAGQYTSQSRTWKRIIPILQRHFAALLEERPAASEWRILLEYPLYRLRRRIDVVVLAGASIIVVECKESKEFLGTDRRQVEEYALDLRDFHAASHGRSIAPVLWCIGAPPQATPYEITEAIGVTETVAAGSDGLLRYLLCIAAGSHDRPIAADEWNFSPYRPVPKVIEAATSIFAGHDVRSIANADSDNLGRAAARLIALIKEARSTSRRYLLLLTGVPGSGKTLAGLHVVHSAIATGVEQAGDIVYLSGNTPLVTVLREALARDERRRQPNTLKRTLAQIRLSVRARIQHINDFLKLGMEAPIDQPPHEHVIVFDEAQRAWDEKQGLEKFGRTASEPALLLELMSRHKDWCTCVCLVGGGQEINSGEEGVLGWGEALRKLSIQQQNLWSVFAPPDVYGGGPSAGTFNLGVLPSNLQFSVEPELQLRVPQRSYRSPELSLWVDCLLKGDVAGASEIARRLERYPIVLTRSLASARAWLKAQGRGERRYGLLASSEARRLRAEGLGLHLHANAGAEIAHWYLNEPGDIRASYALEVPANEYTCQGLELDFAGLCWGGDLLWSSSGEAWTYHSLSGTRWQSVKAPTSQRFLMNSYRVLLTRAREGLVLWVPSGDVEDSTRPRLPFDSTAIMLERCGARPLD